MKVMIHSYKGGAGKTLLAINLAHVYANQGKKTLLIEADFRMPTYTDIFSEGNPDMFFNDYLDKEGEITNYIYEQPRFGFDLVYAFPDFRPRERINDESADNFKWFFSRAELLKKELDQLDYDVIIFDLSPGNHFFSIVTLKIATHVLFVIRPYREAVIGSSKMLSSIYKNALNSSDKSQKQFHLIFNQVPKGENSNQVLESKTKPYLAANYDIIDQFFTIPYDEASDYYIFENEVLLLEDDDPVKGLIAKLAESLEN